MGFLDTLWSSRKKGDPFGTTTLSDLREDGYEIVFVDDSVPGQEYAIAEPVGKQMATTATKPEPMPFELGTTSASPWTSWTRSEYNPALAGLKGLEAYDKMRKSDGTVRGTLRAVKTPVLGARYFIEAGGEAKADQTVADLVWKNITEMTISFTQVITEALLMLDFGFYMFEKVWVPKVVEGRDVMWLQKLAPRHPMDVKKWEFDAHGGPVGVWMFGDTMQEIDDIFIPIQKLLIFTFDRESGNVEGISVLRSAYKHWYFKEQLYKIDAIQKERHGIGIPVIKLPMGYSDGDKVAAQELGRNIRTNERAHIVLPPGWEVYMLKLEGNPVDALKSIEHHNAAIRENILLAFMKEGAKEEDMTMFLKATRFIADIVTDTFNLYLIPQMCEYNFIRAKTPKLKARRIGESAEQRTLSFTLRNVVGAGLVIPDEPLEAWVRDQLDLPKADPDTAREVRTPQAGPDASRQTSAARPGSQPQLPHTGPPRQSPVGRRRNTQGTPAPNAGFDQSGGN